MSRNKKNEFHIFSEAFPPNKKGRRENQDISSSSHSLLQNIKKIPDNIDYDKIKNIASEARQKLKEVKPTTIAQAIRISGVNPSDISILSVYLKKEYGKSE